MLPRYRLVTLPQIINTVLNGARATGPRSHPTAAAMAAQALATTTSRHQNARREGRKQKNVQNWYICLILKYLLVTGFGKEKEGIFKNLGLVAAQYNDILACAYSLNYLQYIHNCTLLWSVVLRPLLSFFLINGPKTTLFEVDCWNDLFSLPFEKTGSYTLFGLIARAMRVSIRFSFRFFRHR